MQAALRATERLDPLAHGLDARSVEEMLALLLNGQSAAVARIDRALPQITQAVDLICDRLSGGGRLAYLAAGSPALIALADALEIPQTYGEDPARFITILAGGLGLVQNFAGGPEDDGTAVIADVAVASVGPADCVLAVSASGSTPYVVGGLYEARRLGAATIAIANNADAPALQAADIAILLDTGPEIVAGSTRMGAGTAQKIVLNMISTAVAVRRGHVHDGHMVSLRADNAKLHERAQRMVETIGGADPERAAQALSAAGGDVKLAVLVAAGAGSLDDARERLAGARGHLRTALAGLSG